MAITDKATMAHEFNMYFIQSAEELTQNFDAPTIINKTEVEPSDSFCIKEVNEAKIAEIIKKLSDTKAKDIYNLDTCFIKKYSSILIRPVTHLINLSTRTSKFPNNCKKASQRSSKQGIMT